MTSKTFPTILIMLAVLTFAIPAAAQPQFRTQPHPWQGSDYVPGEVIIKFKDETPENMRRGMAARLGLRSLRQYNRLGIGRYRVPAGQRLQKFIEECRKDPNIEYVEPN